MLDLTCCITSFGRPEYLRRAIQSAYDAGIKNVVVAIASPANADELVLSMFPDVVVHRSPDFGCNESWLRAAYYAKTKRVIILHDDDVLCPEFGAAYLSDIKPVLDRGEAGFATWRACLLYDDGSTKPTEFFHGGTRVMNSTQLEHFLLQPKRLSLSPVISVLDRETLIHALKEADQCLTHPLSYLHPGMLLGTEIIAYLRHCSAFPNWLYVDRVLSMYGSHEGSGTVAAQKTGSLRRLTEGYDFARQHYLKAKKDQPPSRGRSLLTYSPFAGAGEAQGRIASARRSWDYHFNLGDVLNVPAPSRCLPRSSMEAGDPRALPFLRDVIDYAVQFAMPEDVVAYANVDLALTVNVFHAVRACHGRSGGVCVGWRRTMGYDPNRQYLSVKNGKQDGGVDFIAVTPAWWKEHRERLPDMILGADHWDWVFRVYCERLTQGKSYINDGTYHAPHPSNLSRFGKTTPAQQHNRQLAAMFFNALGDRAAVKHLTR